MSTQEIESIARQWRTLQADIRALEEMADSLKQQIIREMDARCVEELDAGEYTIRWTIIESKRLDTAKLKKELPDIAGRYYERMTSTRFQVA